jgi:hypothetical protein
MRDIMTDLASKPKIHRLPLLPEAPRENAGFADSALFMRSLWGFAAVSVLILGFIVYQHYDEKSSEDSFTSKAAQDVQGTIATNANGDVMYLANEQGTIIGQFAKIPPDDKDKMQSGVVATTTNNKNNRDLLSIISKY